MKTTLLVLSLVFVSLLPSAKIMAQDSEYKDTPWFTGMPSYTVYDVEDVESDSYNFYNEKICTTVEGKKYKRTYTVKEDAQKSSVIQIIRNYANAVKSKGGTVIYDGAPQNAECAANNGSPASNKTLSDEMERPFCECAMGTGWAYGSANSDHCYEGVARAN